MQLVCKKYACKGKYIANKKPDSTQTCVKTLKMKA